MSRIGNNPINVPEGVTLEILPSKIIVKGKLGELTQDYSDVNIKFECVLRLPRCNLLILMRVTSTVVYNLIFNACYVYSDVKT